MRRGRGKGRRLTGSSREEGGSGEEEKIPVQRKRGRPQKLLKETADKVEEEQEGGGDDAKSGITTNTKETKGTDALESGKKRKQKSSSVKEENSGGDILSSPEDSAKLNGFRHSGSRRKNKPRRAAEVGVEC